jgi:ketosteroid isomerase-like protein
MGAEENKRIAIETWSAMGKGQLDAAMANMSDNVSWLVPGTIPGVSGVKRGKEEIRKFMSGIGQVFPEGLQSEVRKSYVDGDTVILELVNRGKVANGKFYENDYCFVFEFEAGKIRRIREYVDTQKAKEILFS